MYQPPRNQIYFTALYIETEKRIAGPAYYNFLIQRKRKRTTVKMFNDLKRKKISLW